MPRPCYSTTFAQAAGLISRLDVAAIHGRREITPSVWRRVVAMIIRTLRLWRERSRQRSELMTLARDGFNFNDLGISRALAAREAVKFPWQAPDGEWNEAASEREGR
jgi:uncharacterized protein YjiS (DUF1127 family)